MQRVFILFLLLLMIDGYAFSMDVFQAAKSANRKAIKHFIENESISPSLVKDGLPLIFYSKNLKTARYLLSKGASMKNDQQRTMLMQASTLNNRSMIKYFLKKDAINAQDIEGWTALFYAASVAENTAVLKLLIRAGANINHKDRQGVSALMLAAERGNPRMVSVLLEAGADHTFVNRENNTALMLAEKSLPFAVNKSPYQKVVLLLREKNK
ncbi:MAG: ankyrin repeat domain-containing protein [Brevinema sp.]